MRRRHFLQLFAAVPAVAMAQRAIPAVLGGDPVRGISDEPCGCDENWEE